MGLCSECQLEALLRQSVSYYIWLVRWCLDVLTPPTCRFVDRDMFMRYRGGGIGHKYMRVIEDLYENMSRERIHHKESRRGGVRSGGEATPMDMDDADDGDGEGEGDHPGSQDKSQTTQPRGAADDDDDSDEDDDDYNPDSDESRSSGISDSDDLDSDEDCGYESHGMGDL